MISNPINICKWQLWWLLLNDWVYINECERVLLVMWLILYKYQYVRLKELRNISGQKTAIIHHLWCFNPLPPLCFEVSVLCALHFIRSLIQTIISARCHLVNHQQAGCIFTHCYIHSFCWLVRFCTIPKAVLKKTWKTLRHIYMSREGF